MFLFPFRGKNYHANKGKKKGSKKNPSSSITSAHPTLPRISFRRCADPGRVSGGFARAIAEAACMLKMLTNKDFHFPPSGGIYPKRMSEVVV